MQSSVAMDAPLGLWGIDDDLDDAPTRELVIHRAIVSELEDAPDIVAIELRGRDAAIAALMELAETDALRDDDDPPTREFLVRRFRPEDFDAEQLDALLAIENGDHDILVDYQDSTWDPPQVDLASAIAKVLTAIERAPAPSSPWIAAGTSAGNDAGQVMGWTAAHWAVVAALVLALELIAFAWLS